VGCVVIVWGLCLLLCGGCVCYCVGVVFVIMGVLCLLLWGGCVCYCVGVVFVIMGGCVLLWGGCVCYCGAVVFLIVGVVFLIVWGCVCYCGEVVFLIVIFVRLFKFNNIVWDKVSEVRGWRFIRCCLCQFEIGSLDKRLIDLLMPHFFVPHLGVSALCLKCTEHVDRNSRVVQ